MAILHPSSFSTGSGFNFSFLKIFAWLAMRWLTCTGGAEYGGGAFFWTVRSRRSTWSLSFHTLFLSKGRRPCSLVKVGAAKDRSVVRMCQTVALMLNRTGGTRQVWLQVFSWPSGQCQLGHIVLIELWKWTFRSLGTTLVLWRPLSSLESGWDCWDSIKPECFDLRPLLRLLIWRSYCL